MKWRERMQTVGVARTDVEVRVVDESRRRVAPDTAGHLQARGITHFVGYHKKAQLNSTDAEGWYDTGDLARMEDSFGRMWAIAESIDDQHSLGRAWHGLGMETEYVTYTLPRVVTVRMTRGPAVLAAFAGRPART